MIQIKYDEPDRKARVKKTDWLNAALNVLGDQGIEAVRVERLASRLGVAKSGFYYHFKGRDDLCDALIQYWKTFDGAPVALQRGVEAQDPEKSLLTTVEMVDKFELWRLDLAIRQWAQSDPKVERVYRSEMAGRVRHITRLFSQLGFEGDELSMRARTFVAYTTTERQLFPDMTAKERKRLWAHRIRMLVRRD